MRRSVGVALCALAILATATAVSAESFYIRPHLQNITADGATVIYQTDVDGRATVEYGPEGNFDQSVESAEDATIRKVRITGLEPESTYSYRVTVGDEAFESRFKTAPLPDNDREIVFVVFGDSRRWDNRFEETAMAQHALQWDPEFFVINGDLVNNPLGREQERGTSDILYVAG